MCQELNGNPSASDSSTKTQMFAGEPTEEDGINLND